MSDHPSARADFWTSFVWIGLGGAIVYGSWTMDRLEHMHINPYTAPGLVPGVLGTVLVVCGAILAIRSLRRRAWHVGREERRTPDRAGWKRFALALALCVVYAVGMVGRGVPFWLATVLFVFAFTVLFEWPARRAAGTFGRGVVLAAIYAAGTAIAVDVVFEDLFYVRLP